MVPEIDLPDGGLPGHPGLPVHQLVLVDGRGSWRVAGVGEEEERTEMNAVGQTAPINVHDLPLTWEEFQPPTVREEKQLCVFGQFSEDPLIPGVCNLTTLLGAGVALVLLWWMTSK